MARREGVLKTGEYGDAYIEMANKHDILELVKFFKTKRYRIRRPRFQRLRRILRRMTLR